MPPDSSRRKVHIPGWAIAGIVVVIVVAALVAEVAHQILSEVVRGSPTQTVNNGRQIFVATFNMANDNEVNRDPHLGWPGDLAKSSVAPVGNLREFVQRLIDYDYFKAADVGKVFAAPGITPFIPGEKFTAANSAFKIYLTTKDDTNNVLFLATKNYTFGKPLDAKATPYGEKGFVIVRQGGDALSFGNKGQSKSKTIGLMPGHTDLQDPGVETSANVWKD